MFYHLHPNRTVNFKGSKCHGGAKSKQRLTVVFYCISDGSEKLRSWIIDSTLDNCAAHNVKDLGLSNVKVLFFLPNTTSHLQPFDQGIMWLFKTAFRTRLVRACIQNIETINELISWNILDAIRAIGAAWASVSPDHIKNCFDKD